MPRSAGLDVRALLLVNHGTVHHPLHVTLLHARIKMAVTRIVMYCHANAGVKRVMPKLDYIVVYIMVDALVLPHVLQRRTALQGPHPAATVILDNTLI